MKKLMIHLMSAAMLLTGVNIPLKASALSRDMQPRKPSAMQRSGNLNLSRSTMLAEM